MYVILPYVSTVYHIIPGHPWFCDETQRCYYHRNTSTHNPYTPSLKKRLNLKIAWQAHLIHRERLRPRNRSRPNPKNRSRPTNGSSTGESMCGPHERAGSLAGFRLTPRRPGQAARSIQARAFDCTNGCGKGHALDSKMATLSSSVDGRWGGSTSINPNRGLVDRWATPLAPIISWNHAIPVSKWVGFKWEAKMRPPCSRLWWCLS